MKKSLVTLILVSSLLIGANNIRAGSSELIRSPGSEKKNTPRITEIRETPKPSSALEYIKKSVSKELLKARVYNYGYADLDKEYKKYTNKKIRLGIINKEFRVREGVKTRLCAELTLDKTRRAKNIGLKCESGLVRIMMNYDLQRNHNIIQGSVGRKHTGINVMLRDYKDPVIKAYTPLYKGVRITSVYDSGKDYFSAGLLGGFKSGISFSMNKEWLAMKSRTTMNLGYKIPDKYSHIIPVKDVMWSYVNYNNTDFNRFQAKGRIALLEFVCGIDNFRNPGEYQPYITISVKKKF